MNIGLVSTEDPGYLPVQNIFRDHGFNLTKIPVAADGIMIEQLPANIPSASTSVLPTSFPPAP